MKVTIETESGEYMTATFKPGEFETVSPGTWVDDEGDILHSDYTDALSALARAVSEDIFASAADRQEAAQAMFVRDNV